MDDRFLQLQLQRARGAGRSFLRSLLRSYEELEGSSEVLVLLE